MRVHGETDDASLYPLYPVVACMAVCLPRLEELSLEMRTSSHERQAQPNPSVLAPLAFLPHLARLSVAYPGGAHMTIFQAGLAGCPHGDVIVHTIVGKGYKGL